MKSKKDQGEIHLIDWFNFFYYYSWNDYHFNWSISSIDNELISLSLFIHIYKWLDGHWNNNKLSDKFFFHLQNTTKQTKCHQVESTTTNTNNVSAMMQMTMSKCTQVTAKKKILIKILIMFVEQTKTEIGSNVQSNIVTIHTYIHSEPEILFQTNNKHRQTKKKILASINKFTKQKIDF